MRTTTRAGEAGGGKDRGVAGQVVGRGEPRAAGGGGDGRDLVGRVVRAGLRQVPGPARAGLLVLRPVARGVQRPAFAEGAAAREQAVVEIVELPTLQAQQLAHGVVGVQFVHLLAGGRGHQVVTPEPIAQAVVAVLDADHVAEVGQCRHIRSTTRPKLSRPVYGLGPRPWQTNAASCGWGYFARTTVPMPR